MMALTPAPAAREASHPPRQVERLYTIGVKDGPPILVAICADGTMWELIRSMRPDAWRPLPHIPGGPIVPVTS